MAGPVSVPQSGVALYDRYPSLKSVGPSIPGKRGRPKEREYLLEGIGLI